MPIFPLLCWLICFHFSPLGGIGCFNVAHLSRGVLCSSVLCFILNFLWVSVRLFWPVSVIFGCITFLCHKPNGQSKRPINGLNPKKMSVFWKRFSDSSSVSNGSKFLGNLRHLGKQTNSRGNIYFWHHWNIFYLTQIRTRKMGVFKFLILFDSMPG